jgi:hypothetical protein
MIPLGCQELEYQIRHFPADFQTAAAAFQTAVFADVSVLVSFGTPALLALFGTEVLVFVVFVLVKKLVSLPIFVLNSSVRFAVFVPASFVPLVFL